MKWLLAAIVVALLVLIGRRFKAVLDHGAF
jgi:hypothetical protein